MAIPLRNEPSDRESAPSAPPRIGGPHRPVILVVGGGYVGLYTALRL